MRTAMRKNNYLNNLDVGTELKALASNNVLNYKLLNLQEIATKQKPDGWLSKGDDHGRKFIVVTADGHPYEQITKLISDIFICISCEKRVNTHSRYDRTHERKYVKLIWDIYLSELCKSILFESPKVCGAKSEGF